MGKAAWIVLPWLLAAAPATPAQETVIYRCTDARGVTTLQNGSKCPAGTRQETRVVDTRPAAPFPMPLPAPPAVAPAPPAPAPEPAQAGTADAGTPAAQIPTVLPLPEAETPAGQRLPPPPLYQCNTADNDSYLSDTAEPRSRCVRMDTVGIDGSQQLGAGQACSMVYDQCQRIGDNAACDAWRKRVSEAQAAWTFARAESRDELKAEYERIARVVAETTCNP